MRSKKNKSSSRVSRTSYYRGTRIEKQPKPRSLKVVAKKTARRSLDLAVIVTLIILLGYNLVVKPTPNLSVDSTTYHPTSVYQLAADKASDSLRNRNKLTYNQQSIVKKLRLQFPEISQANISLPIIGQRPKVKLTIARPVFSLASANNQFIVTQAGVIVGRGKVDAISLITMTDKIGLPPKDGEQLLSANAIAFIEQVLAQAKNAKVNVSSITLPASAQEFDLYTKDASYYVKFYLGGDPLLQGGEWLAARHQFSQKSILPSQYLDVRIAGKIFYK